MVYSDGFNEGEPLNRRAVDSTGIGVPLLTNG